MDERQKKLLEKLEKRSKKPEEITKTVEFVLKESLIKRLDELRKTIYMDENELVSKILDEYLPPLPPDDWSSEESTAYHEAGHAVIMYAQNQRVDYASIISDGETFGYVEGETLELIGLDKKYYNDESDIVEGYLKYYNEHTGKKYDNTPLAIEEDIESIKRILISNFAGGIAEKHFTGVDSEKGSEFDNTKSQVSTQHIFNDDYYSTEFGEFYGFLYAQAENYVYMNLDAIELIAKELLKKKKITGDELGNILKDRVLRKYIL